MQMQFNLRNALNKCFFVQHRKESKFVNPGIPNPKLFPQKYVNGRKRAFLNSWPGWRLQLLHRMTHGALCEKRKRQSD